MAKTDAKLNTGTIIYLPKMANFLSQSILKFYGTLKLDNNLYHSNSNHKLQKQWKF